MKMLIKYCFNSIKLNPIYWGINFAIIIIIAFARFGITYSFKWMTDTALWAFEGGKININIVLPVAFLFCMLCIGSNTANINNYLELLCTSSSKKIYTKIFQKNSYQEKQDTFYKKEFYDNYEFVKKNLNNTSKIAFTIFNKLFAAGIQLLLTITAITVFNLSVLVFIVFIAVIMYFVNGYIVRERVKINKKTVNKERKSDYYTMLLGEKKYAKELRVYNLSLFFLGKWESYFLQFMDEKIRFENKSLFLSLIPDIIQKVLSGILTVYFLRLVSLNKMSIGDFTFLFGMMMTLMAESNKIIQIITGDLPENIEYIEKFDEFIKNTRKNTNDAREGVSEFDEIKLKSVSYKYPNQKGYALKSANFSLRKGEVISILGYNGSGKTTLSKVLCGLLEDYEGEIILNGKNLKDLNQEDVFRLFGVGFQEFTRYSLTMKENVGVGKIEYISNSDKILQACKKGGADTIIDKLPNGLDSILGKEYDSNGTELSRGEWQKIVLSRAYMGNSEILILDEPTASVDPIQEMELLANFRNNIENKTAILISHRIGFAKLADRIYFMENGEIIESGSHEQLLQTKGRYYELYENQKMIYEAQ